MGIILVLKLIHFSRLFPTVNGNNFDGIIFYLHLNKSDILRILVYIFLPIHASQKGCERHLRLLNNDGLQMPISGKRFWFVGMNLVFGVGKKKLY
jgi:hypothetical protein